MSEGAPAPPPIEATSTAPRSERHLRLVLGVTSLALFCVQLDFFALNLAVPGLARELGASATSAQWVISAYMLALGSLMVAGGRLGDVFGRRRLLMIGVAVFGAASVLCALAPSLAALVVFRALQGAGAALILPGAVSVLTNAFGSARAGRAIGIAFGLGGIGNGLGPFVGGALTEVSWRLVFWLNVPFVIATLAIGLAVLPESRDESVPRRIDVPGVATVCGGLVAFTLAVNRAPVWGWTAPATLATFAAAAALLAAFAAIELRARWPLIELSLARNARFTTLAVSGAVCNLAYGIMIFGSTLYLQNARGLSPLAAGVMFLGPSTAAAVAGPLSGYLGSRMRAVTLMGCSILVGGLALLALAGAHAFALYIPVLTIAGLGFGLVYVFTTVATQAVVPAQRAGEASGVVLTMLVTMAGVGVVGATSAIAALERSGSGPGSAIPLVLALTAVLPLCAAAAVLWIARASAHARPAD